eukprot:CAMPEP_0204823018 /NCGR_PEP_ID=MMETSP1346-20131115/1187_1 /ASSEMBLY_ACC=CAM_ASM_000771 /TAXON_ID=215587 /ORGANISM="Aplanochytrium stocchinoi, Strain GSBS06" /LENGTH=305 /DNA_ID=CAMNT_0051949541 /DNA_START=473 /DNA_END=1390 /DNA_ORIENTATION=-
MPPMTVKIRGQGSIKPKHSLRGTKRVSFFPDAIKRSATRGRRNYEGKPEKKKTSTIVLPEGPRPTVYEQMKSVFDRNIETLSTYKDLGRLISRLSLLLRIPGQGDVVLNPIKSERTAGLSGGEAEIVAIVSLLSTLLKFFEEKHIAESFVRQLKEVRERYGEVENRHLVKEMVALIGTDSRSARVLKCINQSIVLQGTFEMKSTLTKTVTTKDVREEDGWLIVVTLAEFVQVKHTRKEHCTYATRNEPHNRWDIEWEVRLTFDRNMEDLTAAQLRITNLHLGDAMDEEVAEHVRMTFGNGKLIVG